MAKKRVKATNNALSPFVDRYISSLRATNHSPNTLSAYGAILHTMATMLTMSFPVHDLADIKGYMVETFVQGLSGIGTGTRNYYIGIIREFFDYLEMAGYISRNPSVILQRTRVVVDDAEQVESLDERAYTDRELLAIMRSCTGELAARDRAIVAMLSGSGLRASELCDLTAGAWRNSRGNSIYVRRKGGARKWVTLATYIQSYVEDYLAERGIVQDGEPLFVTATGLPITRQALYKILAKRQKKAGVRQGVHIFRHTFITGVKRASDLRMAQTLGGHKRASTTRLYVHTDADERRSAVDSTAWASAMLESN